MSNITTWKNEVDGTYQVTLTIPGETDHRLICDLAPIHGWARVMEIRGDDVAISHRIEMAKREPRWPELELLGLTLIMTESPRVGHGLVNPEKTVKKDEVEKLGALS